MTKSLEDRYIDFIRDVLITIHENIRELENRMNFADPEEHTYIQGKITAYREMLTTLRMSADTFDLPKNEIGL